MTPSTPLLPLIIKLRQCCQGHETLVCEKLGLSASDYAALMAMPANEAWRGQELALALSLSPSRATRVADALVARGLLVRTTAVDDRRALALRLTPKGVRAQAAIRRALAQCERILERALSEEERMEAAHVLGRLLVALKPKED